jgi:hypothetical protein
MSGAMTVKRRGSASRVSTRLPPRGSGGGNGLVSGAALDVLLGETAAFLLAAGLPRQKLAAQLRTQARRVARGDRLQRLRATRVIKEGHENLVEIAGVLHDWHRQRRYTDKRSGNPIPLRSQALRKLISNRFPRGKVESTFFWMQANGVVARRADGFFVPLMGRQVVLRGHRRRAMERTAALVPQYLKMALRNARAPDPRDRDVDRDARVFFLPLKYARLWRAVALERTQSFLEGLDNWLEDHSQPDFAGPTVEAAVHSYCYTGDPRSVKRGTSMRLNCDGNARTRVFGRDEPVTDH